MSQIALPLTLRTSTDPERIVIGNANRAAYDALQVPQDWPFKTAVLTGPPRSGKSLLGKWAQGHGIVVIDGADRGDETQLFHHWNAAQESGEALLLISDAQPWEISLPDLRSRLGAALQLEIGVPDDDMVGQLIEVIAQQYGLSLADGAAEYLAPRVERSFAGIENLVRQIDRLSLERKAPATMSIWRAALNATQGPEQARLI
ncbi:MAG TPA: ATPase [Erythrobacter sp.]|nr:ATPase [Erythrobacter sp.]